MQDYSPREDVPPPYGQSNSGSYQIDHQTLRSSPALVVVGNMNTFETGLHRIGKTPPPQVFSSSRSDWDSQATSRQRYHGSLCDSKQAASPWRQDPYSNDRSDDNAGFCTPNTWSARPMQNTPSNDSSSPSSPKWSSQSGTVDSYSTVDSYGTVGSYGSYDSSNASYPQPKTMGLGSNSPKNSHQISLAGMPLVASPDASSPAPSDYQSGSPAPVTVYTAHPRDSYFLHDLSSQYPVKQEPQPACDPQDWGHCPSQNANHFVLSPLLPYQPTNHDENPDIEADHPGPGPYPCDCGKKFGRLTDLERHRNTSKTHNRDPRGPACPLDHCSYPSRFTRADNFKAHYMKQHGVSSYDADAYIRRWKDWGRP